MVKRDRQAIKFVFNLMPDITVGVAVAYVTKTGWTGFLGTVVALQVVYLAVWLKNLPWRWLSQRLERGFSVQAITEIMVKQGYPCPSEFFEDPTEYFVAVSEDENLTARPRVSAAGVVGALSALRINGLALNALWSEKNLKAAIEEYRSKWCSNEEAEDDPPDLIQRSPLKRTRNLVTVQIGREDLTTLYWLATNGFQRLLAYGERGKGGFRDKKAAESAHEALERLERHLPSQTIGDASLDRMGKLAMFWPNGPLSVAHQHVKRQWVLEEP